MSNRGKSGRSRGQGQLPFPYLTVAFFLYLSLYFFAVAADLSYWNHRLDLGPTLRVAGTITRLEKDGGRSVTYKIDYLYTDGAGQAYHGVAPVSRSTWNAARVGAPIPIDYLADHPARSRFGHGQSLLPLIFGLGSAAFAACIGISRKVDLSKHVRLGPPSVTNPQSQPEQVFRATLDQHWPFSLILIVSGCMLLYLLSFGTDEPYDTGMIGEVALFPAALFLVALPPLLHFRFYVRLTDDYFETRGFGGLQRIAWRELTDVWQFQTPQTAFASPDRSFVVNFKLFPRNCYVRVCERIQVHFGKSI